MCFFKKTQSEELRLVIFKLVNLKSYQAHNRNMILPILIRTWAKVYNYGFHASIRNVGGVVVQTRFDFVPQRLPIG